MHEPLNYPVLIIFDKLLLVVRISYDLNRFSNDLKWIFRDFFIEFYSCIIPQKFEKSCPKEVYYCLLEDSTRFHQTIGRSFARFLRFLVDHFLETLFWLQNITSAYLQWSWKIETFVGNAFMKSETFLCNWKVLELKFSNFVPKLSI